VEIQQTFTNAFLLERFKVTAQEAAQLRLLVCNVLDQVKLAPGIILERHIVLRIDRIHFTIR